MNADIELSRKTGHSSVYRFVAARKSLSGREGQAAAASCQRLGPVKGAIVNNIIVGNLSPNVAEQDIRSLFEKHGAVQRSKLMTDRWTGLSRGFGFVQMKTDTEAEKAIVALNGTDLDGKPLKVDRARLQLHRTARGRKQAIHETT